MNKYFRVIRWKKKHDAFVRDAYAKVFDLAMAKTPRQNRWCGSYMIGTHAFTEEKEAEFRKLIRGKGKIMKQTPKFWWDV